MKRAYSLVRFSSWKQAKGQSRRRQAEWSAAWSEKHGYMLDESLRWDKPVSAFRGANRTKGALAAFLEMIQVGRVPKGSVLLVESLDRLSREELDEALTLFFGILRAGVDIVTATPERRYTKAAVGDIVGLLEPLVIMSRAHEESLTKSKRIADVWEKRREAAGDKPMNGTGPAWLRMEGGRWAPVPERVATVRRIFRMAIDGHGLHAITQALNREKVPALGRSKDKDPWVYSYVGKILRSRSVLGELQPHAIKDGKRVPVGPVVPGYYPPAVDEATFYQAQQALDARRNQKGPRGKYVRNLFTGLLRDARDGCTLVTNSESDSNRTVKLVSSGAMRGRKGSDYRTFPYDAFEGAVLRELRELKASDVMPRAAAPTADAVAELSGRLQGIEHRIGRAMAEMKAGGEFDLGMRLLRDLEAEKKDVAAKLEKAKAEAATDEAEVLGEAQTLIGLLAGAEGDELVALRTKVKGRLAGLIASVQTLIVPRGSERLCAAQVNFAAGGVRVYLIHHRAGSRTRAGEWSVRSMPADAAPGLDLRKPADARKLAAWLESVELGNG